MRFLALLNKDSGAGLAVNALAQMSLGLGHRVHGYPDVSVYFGDASQVRSFRTLAEQIAANNTQSTVYSDFPHTMQGGDTTSLLDTVVSTPEENITYFATCILAPEIDPRLQDLVQSCSQLDGYVPYVSEREFTLLPKVEMPAPLDADLKTTTIINSKLPLAQTLNQVVLANLDVGRIAPLEMLHLLTIGRLTHISFNTHPIVKPESVAKHKNMAVASQETEGLFSRTHYAAEQPVVTVTFGPREIVETVISRKQTRAFATDLNLVPVAGSTAAARGAAGSSASAIATAEPSVSLGDSSELAAKIGLFGVGASSAPGIADGATNASLVAGASASADDIVDKHRGLQ